MNFFNRNIKQILNLLINNASSFNKCATERSTSQMKLKYIKSPFLLPKQIHPILSNPTSLHPQWYSALLHNQSMTFIFQYTKNSKVFSSSFQFLILQILSFESLSIPLLYNLIFTFHLTSTMALQMLSSQCFFQIISSSIMLSQLSLSFRLTVLHFT